MQNKTFDRLLFFALIFLAYWFFGNLYEEIVLVPNHLINSFEVLTAYHQYFVLSEPTYYFVPLTQTAVLVVFLLYWKSGDGEQKGLLRKAAVFGLLSLVITAIIVTQINAKLFAANVTHYQDILFDLSVMWLVGNLVRMFLVGGCLYFVWKTYILRQTAQLRDCHLQK